MIGDSLLRAIDEKIQSKHLLNNPFYLAWSKGELSIDCLKEYAKEYYQHVQAFPAYLSAIHSRCSDLPTRRILLQNLIEEEAGSPNHPELWKNFALALGVTEKELSVHQPSEQMRAMIDTFRTICSERTIAEGVASLYSYESQIPAICLSKIEGLKMHYGKKNPKDWEYFSVHIAADKEHAAQERKLLARHATQENSENVLICTDKVLDALWNFLSSMCQRYGIAMQCA